MSSKHKDLQHRRGRSGRPWQRVRRRVLARSTICWLCGQPGSDTVDHVVPLSMGGAPLDERNLRPAHRSCNSSRGVGPARTRASEQW